MNNTRSIIILFFGILLGLLIYNQFGNLIGERTDEEVTSLVDSAIARPATDGTEIRESISETRKNAITQAVNTVSPAVISVNVTQIREFIQRSPFSSDPFFREFFPELFRDRRFQQKFHSVGSGFLISKD